MEQLKNLTGANGAAARRPRWSATLKWIVGGTLMLIGCVILLLACLIVPEYLRAGQPPQAGGIKLALLAPAEGLVGANATDTDMSAADSAATRAVTRSTNAATSDTTPRLKFKPFIDADSKWGKKVGKDLERVNALFDAIMEQIAKYEAVKRGMDIEWDKKTCLEIMAAFHAAEEDLVKCLGITKNELEFDPTYNARQVYEFNKWCGLAHADYFAREGQYEYAAKYVEPIRRQKTNLWMRKFDRNQPASFPVLFSEQEYQALWSREMAYWRQAGGFEGFKGIALSVLERKAEEIFGAARNAVLSVKRKNSSGSR